MQVNIVRESEVQLMTNLGGVNPRLWPDDGTLGNNRPWRITRDAQNVLRLHEILLETSTH
jgi:hypothetical protein